MTALRFQPGEEALTEIPDTEGRRQTYLRGHTSKHLDVRTYYTHVRMEPI